MAKFTRAVKSFGGDLDGLLVLAYFVLNTSELTVHNSEIEVCVRIVGPQLKRLTVSIHGFVKLFHSGKRHTQCVMCIRTRRIYLKDFL